VVPAAARRAEQLARLQPPLLELCFERGLPGLRLEDLLGRAGLGRDELDPNLADLESVFCAVLEVQRDDFFAYLDRALAAPELWVDRLRAVAYGLLRYLRADPLRAHFLTVELQRAGERAARIWTETIVERLFDLIDEGRELGGRGGSRATAEAIGGTVLMRINAAAQSGDLSGAERLLPEMMYVAVLPYLGPEAAEAELSAPPPPVPEAA
jgi:hypothetical protein